MKTKTDYLAQPEGLDANGQKAYQTIRNFLEARQLTDTGGCRTFYSPEEWRARGEEYGRNGVLIVVYDGGMVGAAFDYDSAYNAGGYTALEAMSQALHEAGLWVEPCTRWYAAVYDKA